MSRAAFLAVYADEVKRGDAHAFVVNYTKFRTIDEHERILRASKRARAEFRDVRNDPNEVVRRMMKARIAEREPHGK